MLVCGPQSNIFDEFQLNTVRVLNLPASGIAWGKNVSLRRSKLEIIISVLDAVRCGSDKPTRIMYAANLSWRNAKKVLESLVKHGLLTESSGSGRSKKRYALTEKGHGVLDYIEGSRELIEVGEITI